MLGPVFRSYEPARDRLAAVKAFRLDVTPEQARALADELQRLVEAGLVHPSIVAPIAAGIEASTAYLAEEYVAGESLDVAMRQYAPAAVDKALPFIAQLAGAIDFARAAGVGHGTLHPRDIFITPDEARATGFGIAGALASIGVRPPVRRPYSAPERVAGEAWGAPADVFTLAAIAYELLTGRRIAGAVRGPDALAVDGSDPRDHPKGSDPILGSLVGALSRALAEDPSARYQSALAFARALEAAADGEVERDISDTAWPASVAVPAPHAPALSAPPPPSKAVQPSLVDALEDEAAHRAELAAVDEEITDSVEPGEPRLLGEAAQTTGPALFDGRDEVYRDEGVGLLGVAPPADRPRGSMLPLAIVLIAGLLVGFVAGYAVGTRTLTDTQASADLARAAPPAAGAPGAAQRDAQAWSEQKVADAQQPAAGSPAPPATEAPAPPTDAPASDALRPAQGAPSSSSDGTLTVRSTPSKVGVVIDGRWRGRTPLTLTDLSLGEHTVRVVEPGFVAQNGRVTLTADQRERDVSFTLPRERGRTAPAAGASARSRRPAQGAASAQRTEGRGAAGAATRFSGSLYVDSRPRGARVFLDGRPVGTTPLQLGDVAVGSHVVRLELTGHRTWTSTTRVVAGQPARVTGSLEQVP